MSAPALLIRDADAADLPALSALQVEVARLHAAARPDIFAPMPDDAWAKAHLQRALADPAVHLFVATREGAVIGLMQCAVRHVPQREGLTPRTYGAVEDLVVAASARGGGVGRMLMARAEEWARERDLASLELTVWGFNTAAQRFYETLGYTTSSRVMIKRIKPVEPDRPA
jgi:ribosomal protein S18 acetylase RimI-like enzyme